MRASPLVVGLATALIATILISVALQHSPTQTFDIGAPGDAYAVANFYSPEQDAVSGATFRWGGPGAALLVPEPYTSAAIMSVRLRGNSDRSAMAFGAGEAAGYIFTLQPAESWRVYRVLAPRHLFWDAPGKPATIQLRGATSDPHPDDPRQLGVAIDLLQLKPLPLSAAAIWPSARQALLLTWMIALVCAGLWFGIRSAISVPARRTIGRAFLGIPLALTIAVALWAWRAPASVGWALPLSPLWLSVASVGLGLLWAGSQWLPRRLRSTSRRGGLVTIAGLLGLAHLLLLLPGPVELRGSAALVILGTPGALLARLLLAESADILERLFVGLCGALALPILLLLALQLLPAAIAPLPLLIICDLLSVLAGLALLRRGPPPSAGPPAHPYLALLLILLLGAAFRLPFLGRAELHDDEATAIVAATRMIGGLPDQLLIQLKGPVQVLLPLGPMALLGQVNEWLGRMPFFLAGMGVILGGYLLAFRLLDGTRPWAALAVAAILACDGFLIAFSRIVQYQSIVMLMGMAAFWCCWRFAQREGRAWPDLVAAAIMMAVALLSHYDAIYVALALAWLVFIGGRARSWGLRHWLGGLALPVAVGAGLLLSFYLPFVLHPHFSETLAHIGERSGQQSTGWSLYNNLAGSFQLIIFYNTIPAVVAAVSLLAGTLAGAILAYVGPRPLAWLLSAVLIVATIDLLRGPGYSLLMERAWLAAAALGLPMAALALSRATPPGLRASLIWFGAACLAVSFLLEQPRTHMHVMDVPAALLIGQGLAALGQSRRRLIIGLRPWLAAAGSALLVLAMPYAYTLFIRQMPEYQRQFPTTALAAYPALHAEPAAAPFGGSGRLGYPAQDGWKVVGELYRNGTLDGPFASNQSTEVTSWYTRGLLRCNAEPEYYLIAMSLANPSIPPGYHLFGMVQVSGQNQLLIYSRAPAGGSPQIFDVAQFRSDFDRQPLPRLPAADAGCAAG